MIENKQYISIAEYAALKNISKQAVYKKLNGKLKPFVNLVDGVKVIDTAALSEDEKTRLNDVEQQVVQLSTNDFQPFLQSQIEEKDKQIERLYNQLEALQAQNTALTEQNGRLTDLLNNSQLLLAMEQKKQIDQGQENPDETEEPKKKYRFFNIFHKNT